ncbi:MAG: HEAT repeat domain-containing protein [Gemmataceae bacterium]|nr:HEAT repeat domain-containing protein [Gemmataceae bacterium]
MSRSASIAMATVFFLVTVSPLTAQFTPPPKLVPEFQTPSFPQPPDKPVVPTIPMSGPPRVVHKDADRMLVLAFGDNNRLLQATIRMWIEEQGFALIATNAAIESDDVRLTGVAIAFFTAKDGETRIKTLRASGISVVLKFQKAPVSLAEFGEAPIRSVRVNHMGSEIAINAPFRQTEHPPLIPGVFVGGFMNVSMEHGLRFAFDSKLPASTMLPTPVKTPAKRPAWNNEDLSKVAELTIGEPIATTLSKDQALEATARMLAKMNHLNRKKTDGFILELIAARADLQGLPFRMGEECRTREEQARVFNALVEAIHQSLAATKRADGDGAFRGEIVEAFWQQMHVVQAIINNGNMKEAKQRLPRVTQEQLYRATVAALTQILMPESEHFRHGLAKYLATIPHIDATTVLANLALYSAEDEVRAAAIEGLKTRRERDYTETLLRGFDYPLPAVAKRAADALVKLERKDVLENLVKVLDRADPRLPIKKAGQEVSVMRELVKINHHRNCALCHAPGNTENVPDRILKVAVPLTSEPLPKPTEGGGYQSTPSPTPDVLVRIDMTYLRQDFSLMMPVNDAHPWPEMQRFDFLVRERVLTAKEAAEFEKCREIEEPGRLSPYHRAALYALRELTGRDTEPTAATWRKLLRLPGK